MVVGKSIGIVCLDTVWYDKTLFAINQTRNAIDIDKIFWFSDIPFPGFSDIPVVSIKVDKITPVNFISYGGYIYTKIMPQIVDTDFGLYIQADGFAVNGDAWDNEFLEYDYIGAPWPKMIMEYYAKHLQMPSMKNYTVGNGGFSLRSRKFHESVQKLPIRDHMIWDAPEDNIFCKYFRRELEGKYNIKYAPESIACKFSMENSFEYPKLAYNYWIGRSFGFHGTYICEHYGYKATDLAGR